MILCDSTIAPPRGPYHLPYIEAVEGKRHGWMTKHEGIHWTRDTIHPPDPRCPECAA